MKKIKLYITAFLAVALFAVGCDKGFDEINTSKIDLKTTNPAYLFNSAIIDVTGRGGNYILQEFGVIQWMVSPFGASQVGANYNQWTDKQNEPWNFFQNAIPKTVEVVRMTKGDDRKQNLHNAARIWKAYVFMQITDAYGDIPYFQAGLGYTEQIITPEYNTQQVIYTDLLKELDEASAALDPAKEVISGELLYGGNVANWKKLGYSLLLRAAMRLSKVDPATAETYVKKAVAANSFMSSNSDNAIMKHTPEFQNSYGNWLSSTERGNLYATKTFVEFLRSKNDPRLGVFLYRFEGATTSAQQTDARKTKDPAKQRGMPIGYSNLTIVDQFTVEGVVAIHDFSQFDHTYFFNNSAPQFHCTYAQTQLLLAEAMVRGWATGDPKVAFENAVRADMARLAQFNSAAVVPAAAIDAYIAAHPLDVSSTEAALEQINYEYWIATFPLSTEAWANWRRTGYPVLPVNPYPSSQVPGDFIRRHLYPEIEKITNKENLEAALNRQFPQGEKMNSRIWWHK